VNCKKVKVFDPAGKDYSCLEKCPSAMYPDENKVCQHCHKFCSDDG
jgi:hypothetical protein